LYGSFIHPAFRGNILKYLGNILIELFIYCLFLLGRDGLVDFGHKPIEQSHNLLIVISILLICKYHIAFLKQVVLKSLPVINGLDLLIDGLVDVIGFGQRIFFLHVGHDSLLNVQVDNMHLSFRVMVFPGKKEDVLENALRAEYFCVLVGHVIFRQGVKGR
jgi:hypothetical protein